MRLLVRRDRHVARPPNPLALPRSVMTRITRTLVFVSSIALVLPGGRTAAAQNTTTQQGASPDLATARPGRDPAQPLDEEYTQKIREYTTEPFFLSPLVDYLPASQNVPTPKVVLGDVAGAPGKLPYTADVNRYMRMLAQASPRVKVYAIGKSEEGREMIAVAVASEKLLAQLDENRARLAKLADPRTINMDDAEAERLAAASTPV